jgi:hypothetical protein
MIISSRIGKYLQQSGEKDVDAKYYELIAKEKVERECLLGIFVLYTSSSWHCICHRLEWCDPIIIHDIIK